MRAGCRVDTPNTAIKQVSALVHHAIRLQRRRWRALVWLYGPPDKARQQAQRLWEAQTWQAPLWVGAEHETPVAACLPAGKARTRLGAEHQLIVLDASGSQGLDPDALGALAGTVSAGGLLVIITPDNWGEQPDPDYARFADYPWQWDSLSAHYLKRLAFQLTGESTIVRWKVNGSLSLPRLSLRDLRATPFDDADCLTADQARTVNALVKLKRRRPLVITADRGRGKSAALGIACARLLQKSVTQLVVTAPRLSAVESLFARVVALCPQGQRLSPARFELPNGSSLCFLAPDALNEQVDQARLGGSGSYLLVDEAAAIPAAMLAHWLAAFPRIAFATTVHGYEGSGRGFALRFREVLNRTAPQWRELPLDTPVRWSVGDPLEATIQTLLLLNAPLPEAHASTHCPTASMLLTQAQLAKQRELLAKLFGLLVQSHYRTTPSDLRQLLDGPGTAIRTIIAAQDPQAVLVTREEGGFNAALAEQVARGERRPQGHLLAQSLAAHSGSREALTSRWRRVARIATHPERRREGLGRRLLEEDIANAHQQGVALYGATFGAEASLLRFWLALGFTPVRLGITRETATGEYAIMVARALTSEGQAVLASLRDTFAASLITLLAFELATLPAPIVALLLPSLPRLPLSNAEIQAVGDVAYAHRDPALARASLQALAREASHWSLAQEAQIAHQQLITWAFQNQPLAKAHGESVRLIRRATQQIIEQRTLFPSSPGG
ncbi:GNAT family N-acetyltransferase [Vreelandella venusta]|uniref:tRNA(Met) cytidine acetyltransferase TmcA n=1 Tax=Vreelandella venusta TaxID=44935 RepID=A0ABX2BF04_9GAMM|nr:GNAT family N-acetyltransferase [Halomonas venusta]AZM97225.1 tRNA(Met) cytidine acetyltransferase [Halomonas venusta]NPT32484.1 tRNA cytosine(34) acetyltransferase TmcA [Halomonas venusta]